MGQEVGGEGMAEHMWRDGFADSGRLCGLLDDLPEAESAHGAASVADKKDIAAPTLEDLGACCFQVLFYDFPGRDAKGYESFLVAFPNDSDKTGG